MKFIKILFSPVFMGSLLIIFAVAMAVATFIENDFGSGAAYSRVYDTRWFELILILLAVNLTGQLIINRLFTKKKLTIALFHLAFILMIIGAGITRYFGWEAGVPAYLLATVTGLARVEGKHHYLSDVFAGATLGIVIGNAVVYEPKDLTVSLAPGRVGLKWSFN